MKNRNFHCFIDCECSHWFHCFIDCEHSKWL